MDDDTSKFQGHMWGHTENGSAATKETNRGWQIKFNSTSSFTYLVIRQHESHEIIAHSRNAGCWWNIGLRQKLTDDPPTGQLLVTNKSQITNENNKYLLNEINKKLFVTDKLNEIIRK
jgi:hypothetical protein